MEPTRLSDQLMTASSKGLHELVLLLLQRGACALHSRADGWTPLMSASSGGHQATASLLLDHGADIGAFASDGFTALMEACTCGHAGVAELLLDRKADVSCVSNDGSTALILTSIFGRADVVKLLLKRQADLSHSTAGGFTALKAASGNGHVDVAGALLNWDGHDNSEDERVASLMSACANGHVGVTQLLIDQGTPATAATEDGTTALLLACKTNRDVARLLIDCNADVEGALRTSKKNRKWACAQRVLESTRQEQRPVQAEARDLDALVRDIEGKSKSRGSRLARKLVGRSSSSPNSSHPVSASSPVQGSTKSQRNRPLTDSLPISPKPKAIRDDLPRANFHDTDASAVVRDVLTVELVRNHNSRQPDADALFTRSSLPNRVQATSDKCLIMAALGDCTPEDESNPTSPNQRIVAESVACAAVAAETSEGEREVGCASHGHVFVEMDLKQAAGSDEVFPDTADGLDEQEIAKEGMDLENRSRHPETIALSTRLLQPDQWQAIETVDDSITGDDSQALPIGNPIGDVEMVQLSSKNRVLPAIDLAPVGNLHNSPTSPSSSRTSSNLSLGRLQEQLIVACGKGLCPVVHLLLERLGPDHVLTCMRAADGWTPLMAASGAGHATVVDQLLQSRQGVEIGDCVAATLNVNAAGKDGFTALFESIASGHCAVATLLLEQAADVTRVSSDGTSPLILACMYGQEPIAELLLNSLADATHTRNDGFSAIRAACVNGHTSVVKKLLKRDVPSSKNEYDAALALACSKGHVSVVHVLLDDAPIPVEPVGNVSSLLRACVAGHHEVAAFLLSRGAIEEDALLAARKQSVLPAVRRILGKARSTAAQLSKERKIDTKEETRDLDELVREIGQVAEPASVGSASRGTRKIRGRGKNSFYGGKGPNRLTRQQVAINSFDAPAQPSETSADPEKNDPEESEWDAEHEDTEITKHDNRGCPYPQHEAENSHTSGDGPCAQVASLCADIAGVAVETDAQQQTPKRVELQFETELHLTSKAELPSACLHQHRVVDCAVLTDMVEGLPSAAISPLNVPTVQSRSSWWAVSNMTGINRAPGTFYTIEVLCADPAASPDDQALGSEVSKVRPHRAGQRVNETVIAARCAGRPVGELALIPYEAYEREDWKQLCAGGIPVVPQSSEASNVCSTSQLSSSRSTSVPDRDCHEEYLTWCFELSHAAGRREADQLPTSSLDVA